MIKIANYSFEGPYSSTGSLRDRSGVYAILDQRADGGCYLIDCGESHAVRSRVENHDRAGCWRRNAQGSLVAAVRYTPGLQQAGRMRIEQAVRNSLNPTCGKR